MGGMADGGAGSLVRGRKSNRNESGAGLVEMAIVIPLLLLLVFAILDFGIFLYRDISLTQGVREAGRQGAVALYNGGNAACSGTPNDQLVCLAKQRSGVSGMAVYVNRADQQGRRRRSPCARPTSRARSPGSRSRSSRSTCTPRPSCGSSRHRRTGLITGGDTDPEGNGWASCKAPS